MKRFLVSCLAAFALTGAAAFGGALMLELGDVEANSQAKAMHALAVARVTACHEPAKSTVTASMLQLSDGRVQRTALRVLPLAAEGTFAVLGDLPAAHAAIEISVTNPEYRNYEPRVLVRPATSGIQGAGMKRFFSTTPSLAEEKAFLE